jgi:hypothetical protein
MADVGFPFLDSYHSDWKQVREVFGENGVKNFRDTATFCLVYSLLHYMAAIVAEYCLSSTGVIFPYIGWGICGLRAIALLYGILSTKYHEIDYAAFGKIACAHPGLRGNKDRKRFTLKDLVLSV